MDWTSEQQAIIDSFKGLDRVSYAISLHMLEDNLPLETIRKLLPLAELAWREKDPRGALVFIGIETQFPSVKYYPDAESVQVALLGSSSSRYVLPLSTILTLAMGPTSGSTQ